MSKPSKFVAQQMELHGESQEVIEDIVRDVRERIAKGEDPEAAIEEEFSTDLDFMEYVDDFFPTEVI